MDRVEVCKLLAVIAAAWPRFEVTEVTIRVWHQHLADIDYPVANAALSAQITTDRFPPTISDIRRHAQYGLRVPEEGEAWGQALAAVCRYGYYRQDEALAAMHPLVAHTVCRYGWAEFCRAEADGVTMGLFMRMYRGLAARERQDAVMPERLRARLEGTVGEMERIEAPKPPEVEQL